MSRQKIVTPAGAVKGSVALVGLPRNTEMNATVAARGRVDAESHILIERNAGLGLYWIPLAPDTWRIQASCEGVVSEEQEITVSDGETVEIDFVFGKE